ncbi:MAG: HPr(Ser) kinase/phosphatase [Clostridiales bacterium]|jgi:HPr kinase/phosphorylase|nr:HPr(Ser) kinase/phosphatase [Clostridiales bacterium]
MPEMQEPVKVKVQKFCSNNSLAIITKGKQDEITFCTYNVNRPGLQLAGFYAHFVHQRVQILGDMEVAYIRSLPLEQRIASIDKLFEYDFPCIIIANNTPPCKELLDSAKKHKKLLLSSKLSTVVLINTIGLYLNELLAPSLTVHGVLVDLYGVGVMILGDSGVGKSEAALEIVQRNHRLVADDAVCIKCVNNILIGQSPPIIKHFMEVRGIGIIDIRNIYGAGSVRNSKAIDFVVQLEDWDPNKQYDRIGNKSFTFELLGKTLPKFIIPVKPGRNIAVILEVAARNYRLKTMGYDAIKELEDRMK